MSINEMSVDEMLSDKMSKRNDIYEMSLDKMSVD